MQLPKLRSQQDLISLMLSIHHLWTLTFQSLQRHMEADSKGAWGTVRVYDKADLAPGVVAHSALVAHTVVGLEGAHGKLCVSRPIHGPLIDVG